LPELLSREVDLILAHLRHRNRRLLWQRREYRTARREAWSFDNVRDGLHDGLLEDRGWRAGHWHTRHGCRGEHEDAVVS
jgi:hypothetical protein